MTKPSVGRVVHYYRKAFTGNAIVGPRAAIITDVVDVSEGKVHLYVLEGERENHKELNVVFKHEGEAFYGPNGTSMFQWWVWPPREP